MNTEGTYMSRDEKKLLQEKLRRETIKAQEFSERIGNLRDEMGVGPIAYILCTLVHTKALKEQNPKLFDAVVDLFDDAIVKSEREVDPTHF